MGNPLLQAALDYASRNWPVFPVWWIQDGRCACGKADCQHPGKHPIGKLVPNGRNSATTDPETVKKWWAQYPQANIGIPTGPESGLVLVDVDPRHGGNESKKQMERQGNFPYTPKLTRAEVGSTSSWRTLATARKLRAKRSWADFPA
jgi:hypothetical protein